MLLFTFESSIIASEESQWEFIAGAKSVYSSGISDSYAYYKPFGSVVFIQSIFNISSEISRYFNYQITDGNGYYDYIDYNELDLLIEASPFDWLTLGFEYQYSLGESEYKNNNYDIEIIFYYKMISLNTWYIRSDSEYDFDTDSIEQESNEYSVIFDYFYSDSISFDAGVTYNNFYFDNFYYSNLDYNYNKLIFRIGTVIDIYSALFLIGGICVGKDSEDYKIMGFDTGLNFKIGEYIKLLAIYSYQYFNAPSVATTTIITMDGSTSKQGMGHGSNPHSQSGSISERSDSFLGITERGESYVSHILSFGVSCFF